MRNRLSALIFAGLLAFGVAACDDGTGADVEAPADGGVVDPAGDPAGDPALDDPAGDPALDDPATDDGLGDS